MFVQLKTPFDSEDLHSVLRSVRILGDVIVVAGSNGFVAVCAPAADAKIESHGQHGVRVMYCYSSLYTAFGKAGPKFSLTAKSKPTAQRRESFSGWSGHSESSTVVCIACSPLNGATDGYWLRSESLTHFLCLDYFVTGDDQGGLAIWKLAYGDTTSELAEADPISVGATLQCFVTVAQLGGAESQREEMIRTLEFLPSGEHLIVGTNERLLVVLVPTPVNFMKYRGEMRAGIFKSICNISRSANDKADGELTAGSGSSVLAAICEEPSEPVSPVTPTSPTTVSRNTTTKLTPLAGLVIKSKSPTGKKVFVNVTHHNSLPACFSIGQCPPYVPPPHILWDNNSEVAALSALSVDENASPIRQTSTLSPLSTVLAMLGQVQGEGVSSLEQQPVLLRPFVSVSEESESEDSNGVTSSVFTVVVSTLLYSKLDSSAIREVGSFLE
jgi:hypothetical protein